MSEISVTDKVYEVMMEGRRTMAGTLAAEGLLPVVMQKAGQQRIELNTDRPPIIYTKGAWSLLCCRDRDDNPVYALFEARKFKGLDCTKGNPPLNVREDARQLDALSCQTNLFRLSDEQL